MRIDGIGDPNAASQAGLSPQRCNATYVTDSAQRKQNHQPRLDAQAWRRNRRVGKRHRREERDERRGAQRAQTGMIHVGIHIAATIRLDRLPDPAASVARK
jgi:hypothetical protein